MIKKIFVFILALCPMVASADYLDDKIANLTKQKLEKIAKLEECQKNTKGLKIAGITTLGVSAIGIGANIGEAVALNKLDTKIETAKKTKINLQMHIDGENRKKDLLARYGTCGDASACRGTSDDFLRTKPGAENAVCVNGAWKIAICKDLQPDNTARHCVRGDDMVTYYDSCINVTPTLDAGNICGDQSLCANREHFLGTTDGAVEAVCVNGQWKIGDCEDNMIPTNKQICILDDVPVVYYDSCGVAKSPCPDVTEQWLNEHNALAAECDTETKELYITECKSTHPVYIPRDGGKPGYKKCETSLPTKKNNDMCTDAETNAIPYAAESWWQNGKCVAKSCKENFYLAIENGVSKGYCVSACSAYQIVDNWPTGGKACNLSKEYAPTEDCARKVFEGAEYTAGMCYGKCQGYAFDNNCKLTGDPIENAQTGQCICNPVPGDVKKTGTVVQLPACEEQVSTKDSTLVCEEHCEQYANNSKCKLTRGNIYNADTKQCVCNALSPRDGARDKKNMCKETTIVSASANNCKTLCANYATQHQCEVETTGYDGINCHCNPEGVQTAEDWDLVSKVVTPSIEVKPDVSWPACAEQEVTKEDKSACDVYCGQYADGNRCKLTSENVYYADTKQCFCNALSPRKREVKQINPCTQTKISSITAMNCPTLCDSYGLQNECKIISTSHDGVYCYCNPEGVQQAADWNLVSTVVANPQQNAGSDLGQSERTNVEQVSESPCVSYQQNVMVADVCPQICSQHAQKNNCKIINTAWNNGVCYCNSDAIQQNNQVWSLL